MKKSTMFFKMALSSLTRRRSRMLVALLAVGIGATILSGLVTLYRDVPAQMSKAFRSYGANLIITPAPGIRSLGHEQLRSVAAAVPEDKLVGLTPFLYHNVRINEQPCLAAGTSFEAVRKTSPYWLVRGGWPQDDSQLLLGQEIAGRLSAVAGDTVELTISTDLKERQVKNFTVAGIVQTGSSEENYLYLDLKNLERLLGTADEIDVIECSVSLPQEELVRLRDTLAESDSRLNPRLIQRLAQSEGKVLTKLQSLVYIVTLVVLALTMVCVATTMMAVVAERRSEIGLRKALGASNRNIMSEFMTESLLLGALGGLFGSVCGYLFARYVCLNVFGRSVDIDLLTAFLTLVISIIVTGLASYIPIVKASKVDPVIVLRGE